MGLKRFFRKIEKGINKVVGAPLNAVTGGRFEKFRKSVSRAVRKNPIIRAVVMAAAIYFTAGAALGAAGSMSAGGSFWGGVQAGLGSAASGLTSGSLLGGAYGAGGATTLAPLGTGAMAIPAVGAAEAAGGAELLGGVAAPGAPAALGAAPLAAPAAPAAPTSGMGGYLDAAGKFISSPGGGMITSTGLKLLGGSMADKAEAEAAEAERARIAANQNVGGLAFGPQAGAGQRVGPVPVPGFDPFQQTAPGLLGRRVAGG